MNNMSESLYEEDSISGVPNGEIALELASKAQQCLILLDVMMPDMDGYEVCRRLKKIL